MPASISSMELAMSSSTSVMPLRRLVVRHIGKHSPELGQELRGLASLVAIDAHPDDAVVAGLSCGQGLCEIGRAGIEDFYVLTPAPEALDVAMRRDAAQAVA